MKKMVVGGWLLVVGAAMAVAAPSVEITKVKLADARDGTVEYAYNVSGDLEDFDGKDGKYWNLVVKVSSGDGKKSAEVTNKCVTAGTATKAVNVKALLGKAYPGVSLFAKPKLEMPDYSKPVQLWAGGPYFAQCNVGATKPEEYGYYFWWGDTVGYKRNANNDGWVSSKDGTTIIKFHPSDTTAGQTYNQKKTLLEDNGWIGEDGNLVVTDDAATNRDAARAHLGYPWRMMTADEMQALVDNCTATWTQLNGVNGCLVTGNTEGYKDKSIFLPAAGCGGSGGLGDNGSYGHYWSSTPSTSSDSFDPSSAWRLHFSANGFKRTSNFRYFGFPVRPVRDAK